MILKLFVLLILEENGLVNPVTEVFEWESDFELQFQNYKYRYLGKENINGKEYIKFSLQNENHLTADKYIFYIDVENRIVSRTEYYKKYSDNFVLESTTNCTYSYNTVTDEDVSKFNVNNYPEYKIEY